MPFIVFDGYMGGWRCCVVFQMGMVYWILSLMEQVVGGKQSYFANRRNL